MAETLAWVMPCLVVALYIVWAFAYDRYLQRAKKDGGNQMAVFPAQAQPEPEQRLESSD